MVLLSYLPILTNTIKIIGNVNVLVIITTVTDVGKYNVDLSLMFIKMVMLMFSIKHGK